MFALVCARVSPSRRGLTTQMTWPQLTALGVQMLSAYEYIHDRGWSHGDLKAENICTDDLSGEAAV
jgi:serine/threonine protein kinase